MIDSLKDLFPDKKLCLQTIRMNVICKWLNEKIYPLEKVQELAGHKWLGTTEKYEKSNYYIILQFFCTFDRTTDA